MTNHHPHKLQQINKSYIKNNQEKVFKAWKTAWNNSFWAKKQFDPTNEKQYLTNLAEIGKLFILTTKDNKIIGFAAISIEHFPQAKNDQEEKMHEQLHQKYKKIAFLHELAVNKNYRGKGIGTKLLDTALHVAVNNNCQAVLTWTEINSKSKELYKNHGFEAVMDTIVERPEHQTGEEHRVYMLRVV